MSKHRIDPRRFSLHPDEDDNNGDDDIPGEDRPAIRKFKSGEVKTSKPHKTAHRRPKHPEPSDD